MAGVVYTSEQIIAGAIDTGDKNKIASISFSVNFRKNSKQPQRDTQGPGRN
jgi:hypothetical protein